MKEILFVQRLADNEKNVRNKALKNLKSYLDHNTVKTPGIAEDEFLKLWKGLFYCMYNADKPLIQEALAEDISNLIHTINNNDAKLIFIQTAFLTFAREWNGIDVFRINKYMMFIRRFLRQVFEFLKNTGWRKKELAITVHILETIVIRPRDDSNVTPLGLKLHICTIVLEELAKIGGENLENRVIMAITQPYFKVLALSRIAVYAKSVREDIIRHLMRQSRLGQMYEEGVMEVTDVVDDNTQQQMTTAAAEDTTQQQLITAPADDTTQQQMTTAAADDTTQQQLTTTAIDDDTTQQQMTTEAVDDTTLQQLTTAAVDEDTTQQQMTTEAVDDTTQQQLTTAAVNEDTTQQQMTTEAVSDDTTQQLMITEAVSDDTTRQQQQEFTQDAGEEMEVKSEDSEDEPLDPRAGKVDAFIPQLNPDFKLMADSLLAIGGVTKVRNSNRNHLYKLVEELQDMAQGCYPLDISPEFIKNTDVPEAEERKAVHRLKKFSLSMKRRGKKILDMQNGDGDSGVDLRPSKAEVQEKLKMKRLENVNMKKKQAKKQIQEKKGLTASEKKRLRKQLAMKEFKRVRAVESTVKKVGAKAGVPTIPNTNRVQGKSLGKQGGFDVSFKPTKTLKNESLYVSAGFSVNLSETGKKRKSDTKLSSTSNKKKVTSFAVSTPSIGETKTSELETNPQVSANKINKKLKFRKKGNKKAIGDIVTKSQAEIEKENKMKMLKKIAIKNINKMSGFCEASTPIIGKAINPVLEANLQVNVIETKKMKKFENIEIDVNEVPEAIEVLKSSVIGKVETNPVTAKKSKKLRCNGKKKQNFKPDNSEGLSQAVGEVETMPQAKAMKVKKSKKIEFVVEKLTEKQKDRSQMSEDLSQAVEDMETHPQTEDIKNKKSKEIKSVVEEKLNEKPIGSDTFCQAVGDVETEPKAKDVKNKKSKESISVVEEKLKEKPNNSEAFCQADGEAKTMEVDTKPQVQDMGTQKTNSLNDDVSEKAISKGDSSSAGEPKMVQVEMDAQQKIIKPNIAKNLNNKSITSLADIFSNGTNEKLTLNFSSSNEQNCSKETSKIAKMWAEPLKKGEYEIIIKSRRQKARDRKNPLKARNSKTFKALPSKTRTININLKNNKTHEYSDYARTVKASPQIPFSADVHPISPAIKKTTTPILIAESASPLLKVVQRKKQKKSFRMGVRRT
ncbi:hypothetical protein Pmani_028631 [Petrolisthes manimaculis]|uniref:Ribosomal RNA processing protein 1 homolog n=1 Tax=Petrolisthes manimaculis TaxID=1843537 RepID=A0AAE1P1W3_9EUCA|nr:hypothetical protein Pmani_028631 [Petrolisthes manimaculis]